MRSNRSTATTTTTRAKKEAEFQKMASSLKKKLRSELPRRRRLRISPVATWSRNLLSDDKNSGLASFSVDSSSCSYFGAEEASCESSRVSVGSPSKGKAILRKREFGEIRSYGDLAQAKSCCRGGGAEASEVSESSCVESNCGVNTGVFGEGRSKLMKSYNKRVKGSEIVKEIGEEEDSKAVVTKPEISYSVEQISGSGNLKENEVVSCISASESCLEAKLAEKTNKDIKREEDLELCEVSRNCFDNKSFTVSNSESTIDQKPEISLGGIDSELACTEQFSYESDSDFSSTQETVYSELQSEIFLENSELNFSDYTPSIFIDSGSEFSERSEGDLNPSRTFSLLLQYRDGFFRSTSSAQDFELVSSFNEEYIDKSRYLRFEDEAEEESYEMLRNRERKRVVLGDYLEEYSSTTQYSNLIIHQRWHMIHWIIERCKEKALQQETMFLGVSLLDRFLSKGFFINKRILQIVGIACLTLATRIEENQPYNSVRQKNILVGSNLYSRCEVVAMEWLVQEVLDFQCFLPTIYNFLWFYLKAAGADEEVEKRAKYLAILLLPERTQMYYMPSTVAAAVVILASLESNHGSPIQRVIETHIRTKCNDLHECIESLEWLLKYV